MIVNSLSNEKDKIEGQRAKEGYDKNSRSSMNPMFIDWVVFDKNDLDSLAPWKEKDKRYRLLMLKIRGKVLIGFQTAFYTNDREELLLLEGVKDGDSLVVSEIEKQPGKSFKEALKEALKKNK